MRSGETLSQIALLYHCDVNDITGNNLHITDFKKLMPGTKLKIPFLNKEVIDTLEETESFISDYYPKFDGKTTKKNNEEHLESIKKNQDEEITEKPLEKEELEVEKKPKISENSQYNLPRYNSLYFGNVPPNLPKENIRKI